MSALMLEERQGYWAYSYLRNKYDMNYKVGQGGFG